MTDFKAGDIVVVPFPFSDLKTTKKRPALVLASIPSRSLPPLIVVAMITSQLESESIPGDYKILKWKESGLLHPSKVRLAKVVSLEEDLLVKRLGTLQKEDREGVRLKFKELFSDL